MKKPNYVFDDELCHWGIKGQKWGDRRFQNEDGSWTPEGRERYGKGGNRIKIEKSNAKAAYNTQKYKEDLKSKAKREKDIRAAQEERNRIKENSKTSRLARKEQGKFDRLNKKEEARLSNQGRPGGRTLGRTKNMSDEELQNAINRLKLQAEYNKQYILATQPNSALVKADRFFDGPTGKFVRDLAVQTIPNVANTATTKILESKLKYDNKIDRDKAKLDMDKTRASIDSSIAKSKADVEKTKVETYNKLQEANQKLLKNIPTGYEWYLDPKTNKWLIKKA